MATILKGKNPSKPYTVRFRDGDGRQREHSFRTRAEANDFRVKTEHDVRAQIFVDPDERTTLDAWLTRWISQHPCAPATLRSYENVRRVHISPEIGHVTLGRLTRTMVADLLLDTMPNGKYGTDGAVIRRGMSRSMVKQAQTLLVAALKEALAQKKITENVAAGIRISAPKAQRAEFYFAAYAELETLKSALPDRWRLAVELMRGCGLRIGEALATGPACRIGNVLRVQEQVRGDGTRGPLKWRGIGEYRDIPLPSYLVRMIDAHEAAGHGSESHWFPEFTEGVSRPGRFRNAFKRGAAVAGLPAEYIPHWLRHTFASVALANLVPITDLARWLGHRDINETHRTYGHLVPNAFGRAVAAMDAEHAEWSKPALAIAA